eukprot:CAMPEP_0182428908 /NCGR_PEP_ID=MMETSP1167-20130531/24502_1 /TAXON_ID=2988 /ORGANISM="Mallomonas Sp, Strain CCMP3275" /LENGTH=125 /DNA_ID=CAMNT_0024612117 /DNA_START=171 /DNA_END=548 /DNA_ORIENTATION=+
MNRASSGIKGVLDNMRTQLSILDEEIKADEESKMEYDRQLATLNIRKADLQKRLEKNEEWVKGFDKDVGPVTKKYNEMTTEINAIYEHAKNGHKRGVKVLEREFGYHPAFKRPQDTFSATPFRPK